MRWRLSVESTEGSGIPFTLVLPLPDAFHDMITIDSGGNLPATVHKLHALVADNNVIN